MLLKAVDSRSRSHASDKWVAADLLEFSFLYSSQKEKKKRKFFMKPQQLKLPQRGEG